MDQTVGAKMEIEMIDAMQKLEVADFTPRGYQQEMFEESMKRNIIVAMTGSGKTDIAVMRVAAELERCDPEKLAWILTPNTALCAQQYERFKERLPAYQHRLLRGSDGVDMWKSPFIWNKVLENIRVVVSTPQVLLDALRKGFVWLTRVSLLVFDEAHRATGAAPMRRIMRDFYHCAPTEERPATLSLTASPAGLGELEEILDAEIKTPTLCRAELEKYVHFPELVKVSFSAGEIITWPGLVALNKSLAQYDLNSDPYILELLQQDLDIAEPRIAALFERKKKTYCYEQLSRLVTRVTEILDQLGSRGADWYVRKCISRLNSNDRNTQMLLDVTQRERAHLVNILNQSLEGYNSVSDVDRDAVSAKFKALVQQLSSTEAGCVTGIIFAKQGATVAVLAYLLSTHPYVSTKFRVGAFVGASGFARKADIGDVFDLRDQEQALAEFRREPGGLLIATSALEEGIDVPSCNFVVCYDEPENVVSYMQRRGRARKEQSKYVIFMPESSGKAELFHRLETSMIESYREDRQKIEKELEEERVEENKHRSWVIQSTGAKLTLDSAKEYLFHFIQTISGDFGSGRPEYTIRKDVLTERRVASLLLPGTIPSHLRSFSGSESWRTERAAVRDVSFVALLALHESGLLSDHLLPLLPEDPYEQIEVSRNLDSTVEAQSRLEPCHTIANAWTKSSGILPVRTLVSTGDSSLSMTFMLPGSVPLPPQVELFSLGKNTVNVKWEAHSKELQSEIHLELARNFTGLSMSSVMPTRLKPGQIDFVVPFLPSEYLFDEKLSTILSGFSATSPIQNFDQHSQDREDMGIVRDTRRSGSKHILQKVHEAIPTQMKMPYQSLDSTKHEVPCLCVRATKFSKRMYSLRPEVTKLNQPLKSTAYDLPIEHCTRDHLPLKYSEFALVYPVITHYWEINMLAEHLQHIILTSAGPIERKHLVEAISAPSAHLDRNYQRLEFLGDRLLKLVVALHLMAAYSFWPEKYLTRKRDQIVSNQNLAFNSIKIGLDRFITTKAFSGSKWRPSYVHDFISIDNLDQRTLSTKVIADVVEAIIGAAFLGASRDESQHEHSQKPSADVAHLDKVCLCANVLLPSTDMMQASAALKELHTVAANEPSIPFQLPPELQQLIGYNFDNRNLLVTAITHPSFSREQCTSYDRLEFLGDAVLDHIVTTQLFSDSSEMPPSRLHTTKECLVSKDFLAFICLNWATHSERVVLPNGTPQETVDPESFEREIAEYHLWHFLRHSCTDMTILLRAVTARFAKVAPTIRDALDTGSTYPWAALTELQAPKFLSDIIESLIGAVFIDSQGSFLACEELLERMGISKYLQRILVENNELSLVHPKEYLGVLSKGREVKYVLEQVSDDNNPAGENVVACTVYIATAPIASVVRRRFKKYEMEVLAAAEAVHAIKTGSVTLPDVTSIPDKENINGDVNEGDESIDEEEEEIEDQAMAGMAEE